MNKCIETENHKKNIEGKKWKILKKISNEKKFKLLNYEGNNVKTQYIDLICMHAT